MNKKGSRRKISSGTKKNLSAIIDNLSIIIGRKNIPEGNPRKIMNTAFEATDSYIAAIALVLPEVDEEWKNTNARDAFQAIKKRRQFMTRVLFALAILGNILLVSAAIVALILMEHWSKWIIFASVVIFVFIGSYNIPKYTILPFIEKYDRNINQKFPNESEIIDNYVSKLIKIIKKK